MARMTAISPLPFMMVVAGLCIPVMASMNAYVGGHLEAPFAAIAIFAAVLLSVSLIASVVLEIEPLARLSTLPIGYLAAGLLFFVYISSIVAIAPEVGLGTAIFCVLLGQLVSSTVIDHFGLFGSLISPISMRRVVGLGLMSAGVFLAAR